MQSNLIHSSTLYCTLLYSFCKACKSNIANTLHFRGNVQVVQVSNIKIPIPLTQTGKLKI